MQIFLNVFLFVLKIPACTNNVFSPAERLQIHSNCWLLEFAAVMIFLSVSNRIFNTARGHAKDLPANQRQSWYTVTV